MRTRAPLLLAFVAFALAGGCRSREATVQFDSAAAYLPFAQQIEYPDVRPLEDGLPPVAETQPPPSLRFPQSQEKWPMTLEEAIKTALANSEVIREIGGRIVQSPAQTSTVYDPAVSESDPRLGVEAALSDFDAQFATQLFLEQTDRRFNNTFAGTGRDKLFSNLGDFRAGVSKTAATGTQLYLEHRTAYNRNDSPANRFPSAYDAVILGGFRHPLLQGSGVEFNRIAGPDATPGNYNGVLIARIRTDISLADFEAAVRDLVRDVERTYWELYFAYRDFDAKHRGRELALDSWRIANSEYVFGRAHVGDEALARQQYYLAQSAMENALCGTPEGAGGTYALERRLRTLLGLPPTDGRMIVPVDEPQLVDIRFDWPESLALALSRRVELRKQRWLIKQRELELVAARNFQRMRLDVVGEYRWRGWGDELLSSGNSAFADLLSGDLQEWRFGLELRTPVGNRVGHAAVRHAELQLAREHARHREMERQIASDLAGGFTELDRAYAVCRSRYNQTVAAQIRLTTQDLRTSRGVDRLFFALDAQREFVTALSSYFRAVVDYELALLNLHFARGTLLDNHQVYLAEGRWCEEAYASAAKLARNFRQTSLNYVMARPPAVSAGPYTQTAPETVPENAPLSASPTPVPTGPPPERLPPLPPPEELPQPGNPPTLGGAGGTQ